MKPMVAAPDVLLEAPIHSMYAAAAACSGMAITALNVWPLDVTGFSEFRGRSELMTKLKWKAMPLGEMKFRDMLSDRGLRLKLLSVYCIELDTSLSSCASTLRSCHVMFEFTCRK